jgi:integrase/recombinase XerC
MQYEKNYSSHTILSYTKDLTQFILFIESKYQLTAWEAVQPHMIRAWIVALMKEKHVPKTISRKLSAIKSYYRFLTKKNLATKNPAKNINGPKLTKKLPAFVREKEMDLLLDNVLGSTDFATCRDRLIIEFFYLTGIRRAELIGLKTVDIDLWGNLIKVTGKRNKQRYIPFGDELKTHILLYEQFKKQKELGETEYFFVRENGEMMYPKQVYLIVNKNLTAVSSLSKRSPHVLRHTFATAMLNNHAGLMEVKELLGHSSLAATEVYTHITFEELKKVYHEAHPREE